MRRSPCAYHFFLISSLSYSARGRYCTHSGILRSVLMVFIPYKVYYSECLALAALYAGRNLLM